MPFVFYTYLYIFNDHAICISPYERNPMRLDLGERYFYNMVSNELTSVNDLFAD